VGGAISPPFFVEEQMEIEDRRVGWDLVSLGGRKWIISTVRLTINHGTKKDPLWFETMIFLADDDGVVLSFEEHYCGRYETIEEAKEGHDLIVKTLTVPPLVAPEWFDALTDGED
jgi:hypothetical protein